MPNEVSPSLPTYSNEEELEQLLLDGLNSGEPIEVTAQFWADLRTQARERFERSSAELKKAS